MSEQAFHCHSFLLTYKKYFFLPVIYGANTIAGRRLLWQELNLIKSQMDIVPWILCGDFNTELYMTKRSDYFNGMPSSQSSFDFRKCVEDLELCDLHCEGSFLTWSNKRPVGFLAKNQTDSLSMTIGWMFFSELEHLYFPLISQTIVHEFFTQLLFRGRLGT